MFNFLLKKMIKSKLKDVPESEQEKIFALIDKNPALFKTIAEEIQQKMREGKDQNAAAMEVMMSHKDELQKIYHQ